MSEHEFELYLQLLGKFLRLRPGQQTEIADELRDHLEARLAELTASGLSRETAIHRALDEFGDAASLADHFTTIVRQRKRRLIMRCTMGTVAAAAAVLVMFTMLAPQAPHGLAPAPGSAWAEAKPKAEPPPAVLTQNTEQDRAVRDKLETVKIECDFFETQLNDVLTLLSDKLAVDIYAPKQEFDGELQMLITMQFRHTQLSGRAALELALQQAQLAYTVRDGLVVICRPDSLTEIRVYNCIELNLPEREVVDSPGAFGGIAAPADKDKDSNTAPPHRIRQSSVEALAEIIPSVVSPDAWRVNGGAVGDVTAWGSLLVVRATPSMHREIELLLQQLAAPKTVAN